MKRALIAWDRYASQHAALPQAAMLPAIRPLEHPHFQARDLETPVVLDYLCCDVRGTHRATWNLAKGSARLQEVPAEIRMGRATTASVRIPVGAQASSVAHLVRLGEHRRSEQG